MELYVMRKEPLGRVVKKWLQQGKDLAFISNLLSKSQLFEGVLKRNAIVSTKDLWEVL